MFHLSELEGYHDIFLQILKSKAEFRRKKENSMNKALCIDSKLFKFLEGTCTFPFFQKWNFWNIWCSSQIILTYLKKKHQVSKKCLLLLCRDLLVYFKMSAFLNVYFIMLTIHCYAEFDSSVKWLAGEQRDILRHWRM